MKYARIVNNVAVDVRLDSPEGVFASKVAEEFYRVPLEVEDGWTVSKGIWMAPAAPKSLPAPPEAPAPVPKIGPIEFKLLFTIEEALAILAAKDTDPVVAYFWSLIDDPRLTEVDRNLRPVKDFIAYLASKGLVTKERVPEILSTTL